MTRLQAGDKAPDFNFDTTAGERSLASYTGQWLVLYFYPKDDTPGCTTEACDFRDVLPNLSAEVLGVSADNLKSHDKFQEKYQLPFPLAVDEDNAVAKAYGSYGEKQMYGKTYMGTLRSTFIIDPEGQIAEAMYGVNAKGHVDAVRARLKDLQD